MALNLEMTEEEIQKDAYKAAKTHSFSDLTEITDFIGNVDEVLGKETNKLFEK